MQSHPSTLRGFKDTPKQVYQLNLCIKNVNLNQVDTMFEQQHLFWYPKKYDKITVDYYHAH
jgi:hypothetical protein